MRRLRRRALREVCLPNRRKVKWSVAVAKCSSWGVLTQTVEMLWSVNVLSFGKRAGLILLDLEDDQPGA